DPSDTRTECQEPSWHDHASTGWATASKSISDVAKQPEYIIEEMTSVVDVNAPLDADKPIATKAFYRVTARGFGASDRSMVVLSTTYKRSAL
ncbi:MAG: pilus assembly PilX family protein, partial [Spongiibacteraceae bacterium]